MEYIDTTLLALYLSGLLGLYLYCTKIVSGLREMLYRHQADAEKHVSSNDLVYRDVCEERVKRLEEQIAAVDKKVEGISTTVVDGFREMKALLRKDKD